MSTSIQPGPFATRVIHALRTAKGAQVVDLNAFRAGAALSAELQATGTKRDGLSDFDPAHALYIYVQNQVSVLTEQLTALPETAKLTDRLTSAEDDYMPSGPPMSPLTTSYFTCWAFFDAAIGERRETLGTCIAAVGNAFGMDPNFLALVEVMQDSCMGVYVHEGFNADGTTNLRDLVRGDRMPCIVPSGWQGAVGELWLARVLPPPVGAADVWVVFTTPYVLRGTTEQDWTAYFDRTLGVKKGDANETRAVLKYGIDWSEYIFAGYAGHVAEAIFLEGLPDVPSSLPHYSPRTSQGTVRHEGAKVGQNEACPCGSGKKYKRCCRP